MITFASYLIGNRNDYIADVIVTTLVYTYICICMYEGMCAIVVAHATARIRNVGGVRPFFFICASRFKCSNHWKWHGY